MKKQKAISINRKMVYNYNDLSISQEFVLPYKLKLGGLDSVSKHNVVEHIGNNNIHHFTTKYIVNTRSEKYYPSYLVFQTDNHKEFIDWLRDNVVFNIIDIKENNFEL